MTFTKGHKLATGRPKGSKNKETLLKEERRAMFEEKISQKWDEIIDKLPPQYVADQFMGKAPDKIEHKIESTEPSEEVKKLADELTKLQQRGDTGGDGT